MSPGSLPIAPNRPGRRPAKTRTAPISTITIPIPIRILPKPLRSVGMTSVSGRWQSVLPRSESRSGPQPSREATIPLHRQSRMEPPPPYARLRSLSRGGLYQFFRDLDRVQGRPFTQIVRHDPEVEAVGDGLVLADAAHEHLVLPRHVDRHRIDLVDRVVVEQDPRSLAEDRARLVGRELVLGLDVHRL